MKRKNLWMIIILVILCMGILGISNSVFAWPVENGIAISTISDSQEYPKLVSDGQGGAIITWMDYRSTTLNPGQGSDLYTQAIDSSGTLKWTLNGVVISTASNNQQYQRTISDGASGAIVTWEDCRNSSSTTDIYAQAVDSSGMVKWSLNGVAICTASFKQIIPEIDSDNQGGAIITWEDFRNNSSISDIYAQAIDSSGIVKWTLNGVAVCTASNNQQAPNIVRDGQGGAIITWIDGRNGNLDIYAQAIDSTGTAKWTPDGVGICTNSGSQGIARIISDGQGGAIITWTDGQYGNLDIYAQAIDSSGTVKWAPDGVAISQAVNSQGNSFIISDGQGGAIITWYDMRNGNNDIYAQAIDSSGTVKWTTDGVAICTTLDNQNNPRLVSDGNGGAIVSWEDWRMGSSNHDIYVQAIDSTGSVKWNLNGTPICTASNNQLIPKIISDGHGGAIVTWEDYRNGSFSNIYAQSINMNGIVPVELSSFYSEP